MKKTTKTGLVIGGLLCLGAGVLWLAKRVKSTCNELEKREKENHEVLEQSGLSNENLSNEEVIGIDEDGTEVDIIVNLPKQLNDMISSDPNYAIEAVDIQEFIYGDRGASEHVVHFLQRYDKGLKRNVLDILFEIPISAQWSGSNAAKRRSQEDGYTCVGNFMSTIRGNYNEEKDIVENGFLELIQYLIDSKTYLGAPLKKNKKTIIYSGISGYMHITYKERSRNNEDEWITTTRMIEVPRELYKNNPFNAEHTGITDFICDLREEMGKSSDENGLSLDLLKFVKNSQEFKDFRVLDAISTIRVTLAVQDCIHMDGINSITLKQIVDNIYNKLEIEGMKGGIFRYEHFLCYVPDLDGEVKVYGYKGEEVEI